MTELLYELLLILLLATAIGWFLGRYLCKSGEYAERSRRQELDKQVTTLQAQLQQRDQLVASARQQLNEQEKLTAELQQKNEGLHAQMTSLQQERDKLLLKLQELDISQSRLATAQQEMSLLTQQVTELKTIRHTQAGQIERAQEDLGQLQEQWVHGKKQVQTLQERLHQLEADNEQQVQAIFELEKDRVLLGQTRLNLEEARSRFSMLDDDKKMLYERFTHLNEEHQQLRQQCQTLRQDTLQFNDRFTVLIKEKENLHQEVEHLKIEKHDYLGRLRAISSVVDMIGTEKS